MGRRSHSQDSGIAPEKPPKSRSKSKKVNSAHADVIDRLDFTGGGPMFHHDGPFDACAPSRNKHPRKAPMAAWSPGTDRANGPYPSADAYDAFSPSYDQPSKKKDALAEAWGIHEPEPFEEFFAGGGARGDTPASSIYNGREGSRPTAPKRTKEGHLGDDMASRSRGTRRNMPPPQPIFVPDAHHDGVSGSPPVSSPGLPKRSKSLMHRIRKMRESPNVPVDAADYEQPPSPSSPGDRGARPTHRTQNSFLGLGRFASNRSDAPSEPFILVDTHANKDLNKELPTVPSSGVDVPHTGYFDGGHNTRNPSASPGGLGRKTSLMKKMKGVVRR
ncbi:Pal1-domain-containing protein [Hymenopellis radicata]|nr:Pal1-domain-containing protein [Hymenopellis radicata]